MEVKTFRAKTMQAALAMVRQELGPDAALLHTRQVPSGILPWLTGSRAIEVVASTEVKVPRRMPESNSALPASGARVPGVEVQDYRLQYRDDVKCQLNDLQSLVEQLCQRDQSQVSQVMPDSTFRLFTRLIEAGIDESLARTFIDELQAEMDPGELHDEQEVAVRAGQKIEAGIRVTGPLVAGSGETRLVALVGPTGVGKTTTIAKLAANYHLRENVKVGLVTVDTYRIAAVDQLRTYAEIIDLPMEVVATPHEMRAAMERLQGLELILMDTAGRSPRDDIKIQELKAILSEAEPDEVHLVLSSTGSASSLLQSMERFSVVGTTALLLTKLDESMGMGHLLPLLHNGQLPLSYLTNGQDVPDDIEAAESQRIVKSILPVESKAGHP